VLAALTEPALLPTIQTGAFARVRANIDRGGERVGIGGGVPLANERGAVGRRRDRHRETLRQPQRLGPDQEVGRVFQDSAAVVERDLAFVPDKQEEGRPRVRRAGVEHALAAIGERDVPDDRLCRRREAEDSEEDRAGGEPRDHVNRQY
jgi:hypothetical protein